MKQRRLIREKTSKKYMPQTKTKINSPPLSNKEIADVKDALKSKGKIYKTPEDLIKDLHEDVADRQKTTV